MTEGMLPRVAQRSVIAGADWAGELEALRATAVTSLAIALAAVGYVWAVGQAVAMNPLFSWRPLTLPLSMLALGLTLLAVQRPTWLRRLVFLTGTLVMVGIGLFIDRSLAGLMVLLVGVSACSLVSSYRGSLVAAGVGTIFLALAWRGLPPALSSLSPYAAVAATWALAAAGWLTSRSLYTVLGWALRGYESSRALSAELQQERGRRNATLKALRDANVLLKRTTFDLAEAREEAERARQMKAQFAANISHELRTPLHLIVGFSQMMYASPESYEGVRWSADLRADVQELYESAVHLLGLIDDVLDLSQIEAARLPLSKERVLVGPLVEDAVDTARHLLRDRNLYLVIDAPDNLPAIDADPTRVRQVLLNLLNNAARFTKTGGITVRVIPRGDEIEIVVEDTGVGIPPEQLDRIFEEFHQVDGSLRREYGGTGLGLAICKQFVFLHGGRIWAESLVGQGSAFHFTLPLPSKVVVPVQRTRLPQGWRHPAARPTRGHRVVTLGKPEEFSRFLRRYLSDTEVVDAADEGEVAELVKSRQADAVILPAEAGSDEVAERLAAATASTSLPVLTCSLPLERHLALIEGFTHCLMKPFTAKQLLSVLQEAAPDARSVLVVDDSPGVVRLIRRSLTVAGGPKEILTAGDGLSAIEKLATKPDVILLDLLLPKASGIQVLEAVRRAGNGYNPPVIAITAYGFERDLSTVGQGLVSARRGRSLSAAELARWIEATLDVLPARHITPADA